MKTDVEYTAIGHGTTRIVKIYPAERCGHCNQVYVLARFPNTLDALVAKSPPNFGILPEVGIYTPDFLEVIVEGGDQINNEFLQIHRSSHNIHMRFGPQSRIFREWLYHITKHDEADYGFDLSPTLRVRPGPPYSEEQRKIIYVLLTRIRLELSTPLSFWSLHFGRLDEQDQEETAETLLSFVLAWKRDSDRKALALTNAIFNNDYPGQFINSFRLLELVLDRLIDKDLQKARRDRSITDSELLAIAKLYNTDLKTKLRKRVEVLPNYPANILREIWQIVQPSKGFNQTEVFSEITKFRNSNVHSPLSITEALLLPWELPAFDLFVDRLLKLISNILEQDS